MLFTMMPTFQYAQLCTFQRHLLSYWVSDILSFPLYSQWTSVFATGAILLPTVFASRPRPLYASTQSCQRTWNLVKSQARSMDQNKYSLHTRSVCQRWESG